MAVTKLAPGGRARCTTGHATLGWSVDGADLSEVVLRVVQRDAGRPAIGVQPTGPGRLLIAALPVPVVVLVLPRDGNVFRDGVSVSAELTLRVDGHDGDQYVLPEVDVSGTSEQVLLIMVPADGVWSLELPADLAVRQARPSTHSRVGAPAPSAAALRAPQHDGPAATRLTPPEPAQEEADGAQQPGVSQLAQRAAYAARRHVGAARLAPEARSEFHVAVDRSASLLPALRTGAVQSLLEVLSGLNSVCGLTDQVPVWELGVAPSRLSTPLDPTTVLGYVTHVLGQRVTTDGTLLAPLVRATAGSGASRTVVVVTDGVPADLTQVTLALRQTTRSRGNTRWHVLAVARGADDPAVRQEAWRNELAPLLPLVAERLLTISSVAPGQGAGWLAARLGDVRALDALVGALPLVPAP